MHIQEDEDIQDSGITEDGDGDDGFETMGGIVSLDNEINLYEYEDDEWLDETDSDFEEEPEPEPEIEVSPTPEPEEYNKQTEFEMVKQSISQPLYKPDISQSFVMQKMSFGQEAKSKTNGFSMSSQRVCIYRYSKIYIYMFYCR